MKKFLRTALLLATVLTFTVSLFACGGQNDNPPEEEKVTVTDMVGDKVAVPKNPQKVACVSRTTYDLLIACGLGDKIDGAYKGILNNPWVKYIYPKANDHFVYGYQDSYETFISRGVDLVFAPEQYIAEDLREHGINAVTVCLYGVPQFDAYVTFFTDLIAELWDGEEVRAKTAEWNNNVNKAINDIKAELEKHETEPKKIFYVRGDKDNGIGYTDTVCAFTEYAYRVLGFDYVGSHLATNKPSQEEVMASDPDVFVCGGIYQNKNMERLHQEPYCNLKAVKNNRIYSIPIGFTAFEQLSAMTPIFFYDQANKIYPEYFDYDIPSMVKKTVRDYFNTDLTDKQVENMLAGLDADGNSLVK